MIRLTLRTLLAYLDDTLPPADAKIIGQKLAENDSARELAERIRVLSRKRSLSTPTSGSEGSSSDPNVVAAYLSDSLSPELVEKFEKLSLESDAALAELAACHQILTLLVSDQVRVPPSAYKRMYKLVQGKESIPTRMPGRQAVPVGGVSPAEKPHEADEADAAYLLGLPAYSKNEPISRKALRWGVAAVLACGFVVAAALAWWNLPRRTADNAVAAAPTELKNDPPPPTPPTPKPDDAKKDDTKKDETKPDDQKKPDPMKGETKKPDDGKKPDEPKKDELGPKTPPSDIRGAIGENDAPDEQVLVVKKSTADSWERVKKGAEIESTDRLVCLPGYRVKVLFKSGLMAELWGNVPGDLLPLPIAETALTPLMPGEGIDSDLTLHSGRVYLSSNRDTAVVLRLRTRDPKFPVKDQQFDITLPDKGSELVAEVQHALTPGAAVEPPRTVLVLHVRKGSVSLPLKGKPTKIEAGEVLVLDSVRGVADGPNKPQEEKGAKGLAYFEREPVYENADKSRATLRALRQIADRMKEAKSVSATVSEYRPEQPGGGVELPVFVAGAVWSVFASAALGDVAELTDLLNDPNRQGIRAAAFAALRGLLAASPDKLDAVRTTARERWNLSADAADSFLSTLAGLEEKKRRDKEALTKLTDQLKADTVAQREAALYVLLTEVDTTAQTAPALTFDVAGPADKRAASVAAWEKRVTDLVSKEGK